MKVVIWVEDGFFTDGTERWVASIYMEGSGIASRNEKFLTWQEARAFANKIESGEIEL